MIIAILFMGAYVLTTLGINGLFVWCGCWALNAIGIHSICGWTVEFSWALVVLLTIIETIFKSIFSKKD
jgi:hypothetical protein